MNVRKENQLQFDDEMTIKVMSGYDDINKGGMMTKTMTCFLSGE